MAKNRWQAAFARLCNYCKKHNEVAQAETKRRAKIAWIMREIEKFDEGKLNRVVVTINQVKD
mgnify:CR=1 FL=1